LCGTSNVERPRSRSMLRLSDRMLNVFPTWKTSLPWSMLRDHV
jgi:hypothetical protein